MGNIWKLDGDANKKAGALYDALAKGPSLTGKKECFEVSCAAAFHEPGECFQ